MITLFHYDFMRHAFMAGTLAAITAGSVGYFLVLRQQSFAGHALSHIGFSGAAGAGLLNISPMAGQLLLTLLAAACMGALGSKLDKKDVAIGIVLAFSLGLGMLFLYLYNTYATQAISILFGDLLGISTVILQRLLALSLITLIGLGLIARPLLFATLAPELAKAKGLSLNWISIVFFILVALAVTIASSAVGILLVFSLLVGPPAAAQNLTNTFLTGFFLSILLGIGCVWLGLYLAYVSNWPVSFWISLLSLILYLGTANKFIFLDHQSTKLC